MRLWFVLGLDCTDSHKAVALFFSLRLWISRMSVTVTKGHGVTVLTLTTDHKSAVPPICQILKNLCYSPVCFSVSHSLKRIQGASQSILGALHIMVGLLNIGLGANFLVFDRGSWDILNRTKFPMWMGGLFILFGIMSILSEKFPSPCVVILNVILSLSGVAFAIAAIVLYSINIGKIRMWWLCNYYNYYSRDSTTGPSPDLRDCLESKDLILRILRSINAVLIILAVLELCVTISSFILGIKALIGSKRKDKHIDDLEHNKPLLDMVI